MLVSQRVFQNTSLPLKNARFTPACAGRLDVAALLARPVLVVAHRQERLVLEHLGAAAIRVDAARVADVVPVRLEPADHRILGVEQPVLGRVAARRERAVVADLVRATGAGCRRTGCFRRTGCMPARSCPKSGRGGPRRLVVAHDERRYGCRRGVVRRDELREVDARRPHRPAPPTMPRPPSCRSRRGLSWHR